MRSRSWLLAVALSVAAIPALHAGLIMDLTSGGTPTPCGSCGANGTTYGWGFTVLNPVTVNGIGVWDAGSDGLGTSVSAGIFTSAGVLLQSATISDLSVPVASANSAGRWLFAYFAPITLDPATYLVGNVFYNSVPPAQISSGHTEIADIVMGSGAVGTDNAGLTAPSSTFGALIFGPTLSQGDTEIPEPGVSSLVAMGLLLLGFSRRALQRR